jgi:hypothetical protein
LLALTSEQREELTRWAQSRSLPAGDVFRARLILALADGMSYAEIKQHRVTNGGCPAQRRVLQSASCVS